MRRHDLTEGRVRRPRGASFQTGRTRKTVQPQPGISSPEMLRSICLPHMTALTRVCVLSAKPHYTLRPKTTKSCPSPLGSKLPWAFKPF